MRTEPPEAPGEYRFFSIFPLKGSITGPCAWRSNSTRKEEAGPLYHKAKALTSTQNPSEEAAR